MKDFFLIKKITEEDIEEDTEEDTLALCFVEIRFSFK